MSHYRSTVYRITHIATGRFYIGVTAQRPAARWSEHKCRAKTSTCVKTKITNAIRKYGPEAFIFSVLEQFDTAQEAYLRERELIALLKPDMNISEGGESGAKGAKWSPEAKEAARIKRLARPGRPPKSPQAIAATVAFHTGRKRSAETCLKIGESKKGKRQTPEAIENNRQAQLARWAKAKLLPQHSNWSTKRGRNQLGQYTNEDAACLS